MGVRMFCTIVEKHGESFRDFVNMKKAVNDWRKEHKTNDNPALIIDAVGCIYDVYGQLDSLGLGQWKELLARLKDFVKRLRDVGVEPIFYFDGINDPFKLDVWIKRRQKDMETVDYLFEALDRNLVLPELRLCVVLVPFLIKHYLDVSVFQSVVENDIEISAYARDLGPTKCLGVLSNDSDFMFYDLGGVPWLYPGSPDKHQFCKNLCCFRMDRRRFVKWLSIKEEYLPILACLLGNDSIPWELLREFHFLFNKSNQPSRPEQLIKKLAKFISAHGKGLSRGKLIQKLQGKLGCVPSLKDAVDVYERQFSLIDWVGQTKFEDDYGNDIINRLVRRHHLTENAASVLEIMSSSVFYDSVCLDSPKYTGLPAIHDILMPIFCRLHGFVSRNQSEKEYYVAVPGSDVSKHVKLKSQLVHTTVTFKECCLSTVSNRHRFGAMLAIWDCTRLDVDGLLALPAHYAVWTVIIYFLSVNVRNIELWELRAMLHLPVELEKYTANKLGKIEGDVAVSRCVHISSLLNRCLIMMLRVMSAVNYDNKLECAMPNLLFDAKLFQQIYADFKDKYENGDQKDSLFKVGSLENKLSRLAFLD